VWEDRYGKRAENQALAGAGIAGIIAKLEAQDRELVLMKTAMSDNATATDDRVKRTAHLILEKLETMEHDAAQEYKVLSARLDAIEQRQETQASVLLAINEMLDEAVKK
jgi:hypothetical protein